MPAQHPDVVHLDTGHKQLMKEAFARNLGPTLMPMFSRGRVSGVSSFRRRFIVLSHLGSVQSWLLVAPGFVSWIMMLPAVSTMFEPWTFVVIFFILLHYADTINLVIYLDTRTGRHCSSTFNGMGKVAPLKRLQKNPKFQKAFRLVDELLDHLAWYVYWIECKIWKEQT